MSVLPHHPLRAARPHDQAYGDKADYAVQMGSGCSQASALAVIFQCQHLPIVRRIGGVKSCIEAQLMRENKAHCTIGQPPKALGPFAPDTAEHYGLNVVSRPANSPQTPCRSDQSRARS